MRAAAGEAPQAPVIGRLARVLGMFHVTGVFWYRIHHLGVRIIPRWLVPMIVWGFTFFFWIVLRRIRRAIASNLSVVMGPAGWIETQRRIWRTMHSFAWCLTERYEFIAAGIQPDSIVEDPATWREVSKSGAGAILVTAHVGNWEAGSAMPVAQEGLHVHVVREEEIDPRAQAFTRDLIEKRMGGHYTTHFASDDPRLGLVLIEALGRGEVVALQADRPRAGGRTVEARLFDRPYALPAGMLALARVSGAPILPAFVLRTGRMRYVVMISNPVRIDSGPDRDADFRQAAQLIASAIEGAVRRKPHQWFCFRELWEGKPVPRTELS